LSWLEPLLEKLICTRNPQTVADEVYDFMYSISNDIDQGEIDQWWNNQIGAAIQLSAVKNKAHYLKEKSQ